MSQVKISNIRALLSVTRERTYKKPFHLIQANVNSIEHLPSEPEVQREPGLKGAEEASGEGGLPKSEALSTGESENREPKGIFIGL